MNQSTIIFAFLFAAFVVFITQRGELPIYLGFILATPTQPLGSATATAAGSTANPVSASDAIKTLAPLLIP